eukprot:3518412-Karenia_brevis.AAC.1
MADLLMQRFEGIKLNIEDGNTSLANHVELAQSRASGFATTEEKRAEQKGLALSLKVKGGGSR